MDGAVTMSMFLLLFLSQPIASCGSIGFTIFNIAIIRRLYYDLKLNYEAICLTERRDRETFNWVERIQ